MSARTDRGESIVRPTRLVCRPIPFTHHNKLYTVVRIHGVRLCHAHRSTPVVGRRSVAVALASSVFAVTVLCSLVKFYYTTDYKIYCCWIPIACVGSTARNVTVRWWFLKHFQKKSYCNRKICAHRKAIMRIQIALFSLLLPFRRYSRTFADIPWEYRSHTGPVRIDS